MISRYELTLSPPDGTALSPDCAYRLYSWLLSRIPEEQGEALHSQEDHPISQYLSCSRSGGPGVWHIALLNDAAHELFVPVLENVRSIDLHTGTLAVSAINHEAEKTPKEIILSGRAANTGRASLQFVSPASFRQAGRYVIYPQEKLIIGSLVKRWNSFCPEYRMDDEDALQMLENSVRITDYSLRTVRFRLKNALIPCFTGKITLSAGLPLPLAELWNALLCWAEYSGIGIKTALGMGGVQVSLPALREPASCERNTGKLSATP